MNDQDDTDPPLVLGTREVDALRDVLARWRRGERHIAPIAVGTIAWVLREPLDDDEGA